MKLKKFTAVMLVLAMIFAIIPAISVSAAELDDASLLSYALSTAPLFDATNPAPVQSADTDIAVAWPDSGLTGTANNGYINVDSRNNGSTVPVRIQSYIGSSTNGDQQGNTVNLPAFGEGSEWVLLSFTPEYTCAWGDLALFDIDGKCLTCCRYGTGDSNAFSVEWGHNGWGNPFASSFGEYSISNTNNTAITSGSTHVDILLRNYGEGAEGYYTATYFVDGDILTTVTYTGKGHFNGLSSISLSRGSGGTWERIAIQEPRIYAGDIPGNIVAVEATYTVDSETVATKSASYDSAKDTGVLFEKFAYSKNGENTLYTADEVTLSASSEIPMTLTENTSDHALDSIVGYEGKQYVIKSANLIPNSDFSYGLAGWYNGTGTAADTNNFSVENNIVTIKKGTGSNDVACLFRAWDVEIGKTYFFTYTIDKATEWLRLAECNVADNVTATNTLKDRNTSVDGVNTLVFTATDEFFRINAAWAEGRQLSSFGLYEIEEAATVVEETIASVSPIAPVTAIVGETVALPATVKVTGSLGSLMTADIVWDAPSDYELGVPTTVTGTASVVFAEGSAAQTAEVKVVVTVFAYDHKVETFWHAGDDSNSPNFGLYNYIGNYNGGVIVAEAEFSASSGTNKLIMYGNSSTSAFGNAGALLRYFNTNNMFEYYNNGWQTSSVPCKYNTNYILKTTIDITNRTYTMEIKEEGGEFVQVTPAPAAFRNPNLSSVDRMISTGSVTFTAHTTTWTDGFSYVNVEYVNENDAVIKEGYRVKAATGFTYWASAPKLIENGEDLYILENVDETPNKVIAEGEDTLSVKYNKVTMVEFEKPFINHVRGDAAVNMPAVVKMVFSDGQKINYNVSWDLSTVNKDEVGTYEVTGTIDGIEMKATATVEVLELTLLPYTSENTVATNNGGWNWYVEPSGTHIQPGDELATRYETEYVSNNGYEFKHDKTYMGWVEDEGTIVVGEYDHDTKEYKRVVVHEFLEADDHNNPAVVVLPDGRIMIFYSKHTTEARMYYCVSKNPEDISEWNPWQYYECYTKPDNATYPATYPTVFMVHDDEGIEGNEVIYVGWRGVHWKPTLAKFSMPDENGVVETIMGQTQFANTTYNTGAYADGGRSDGGRRPYTKYDYDFARNKIYITFTANHPDNDVNNNIYYVTFDITDQNFYTAKGNLLQPLPFENDSSFISQGANGTNGQWGIITNALVGTYPELLLFDANAQLINNGERRGWTWDIKVNEKGEPCIVYVDVTATPPGPNGELPEGYHENRNDSHRSHHYYWYARWDSDTEEWVQTFLTYGGKWWHENATQERCYSGGLTFDHNAEDANVLFLSIPTMGEHGNIFEIHRWESTDHGATWTIREPITQDSKINNVRPNAIYNYKENEDGTHAGPRLLWKSGEYRYWMNYEYKTGVWTDWAGEGFITQDDPEMFADAAILVNGENVTALPVGENLDLTGKFNVTNISIGDGNGLFALAHYNKENILLNVITEKDVTIPARSVPQIGMVGAPKTADGSLSTMGDPEVIVEIPYTATIAEGDRIVLLAWNIGIERQMDSIISVPFSMSTEGNQYALYETFTYEGTEKLILDENGENFNGWVGKAYAVDGAHFGTHSYAAITKAPFGNTGLHLYHVGGAEDTGTGAVMASHSLPDTNGKDYTIRFTMRYIDEMSWNNTQNTGFTLSHGVPVYNDGNATPCALQFRQSCGWGNLNGRNTTGHVRDTRWFDGGGLTWLYNVNIPSYYDRGNANDGLMTGANYEVTIKVSPANKTIYFSIDDTYRKAEVTRSYVDATTFDWDSNPIDTITFSVGNERWGELYVDDLYVEIAE